MKTVYTRQMAERKPRVPEARSAVGNALSVDVRRVAS
jgi:hypothetical protein